MRKLLYLSLLMIGSPQAIANEQDIPMWYSMTGHWASKAIEVDPPELLVRRPYLSETHHIFGKRAEVGTGIDFIVCTPSGDSMAKASLHYQYDREAHRSFGIIASESGPIIRGVIEHGDGADILSLFGPSNKVISTEINDWASETSFLSTEVFATDLGMATVTYLTEKVETGPRC